ncbi:MAG: Autophagy protein 7 [Cyphobasidiales sp. Tagirdzhanova-0007]|nr:MAG: Autophagy protein 7 [Cyphobasidiales sp. Tagirdzhanova-0007]
MTSLLQFSPFASVLTPEFWTTFSKLKIESLRLSDEAVTVHATYSAGKAVLVRETGQQLSLGASIHLGSEAFDDPGLEKIHGCLMRGKLINFNTIEAFKQSDKQALFQAAARDLWRIITTAESPTASQLNSILVIAFAELKLYAFYYWFAFPAFLAKPGWTLDTPWSQLRDTFTEEQGEGIAQGYGEHCSKHGLEEQAACILRHNEQYGVYQAARLADYSTFFASVREEQRILLFLDPSSDPHAAGWPLRNILAYLANRHAVRRLRVICFRADLSESLTSLASLASFTAYHLQEPVSVGWEKNQAGRLAPRMADLGGIMDPRRLADQAVDLNLKLMRWRILPSLNLEKIKNTKCLLLGRVSFSNPVRQPLFEFSDCIEGGKPKAQCAAEALRRIYPSIEATGIQLAIPMPGHPIPPNNVDNTRQAVVQLSKLIDEHDVVYLLMDSRESRWLPTMLGIAKKKLVMNAALGFDSYVVARHGMLDQPLKDRLGCYYCTDIVAPTDSLSDRTLDQMCTVTRPGLAAIAGATAVELMTAVLQHEKGAYAPAEVTQGPDKPWTSVLGAVPHTIRGFLSDFNTIKITGQAYSNCTACSEKIVQAYEKEGFSMLQSAFDDASYLERITGLDKLQAETEAALQAVEWSEEDDF